MQEAIGTAAAVEALTGIGTAEFVRNYWNRTYLHAKPGIEAIREALGGSWGLGEFRAAVETAYGWPGSPRVLGGEFRKANPDGGRSSATIILEPKQVAAAVAIGATVIGDVLCPRLSMLAAALKNELGVAGSATTYGSRSPGGQAAPLHYDGFHVFVVQLEGRKVWRVSRQPVERDPAEGKSISDDGQIVGLELEDEAADRVDIGALETVVLEPGDVLYVPAGVAHTTEAMERSLSVMINFQPPPIGALVETILRRALSGASRLPALTAEGPDGAHRDGVNAGLARVREVLAGLDADSEDVRAAWNEMAANMGDLQNSFAASFRPRGEDPLAVEPGHRMRLTRRFPVRWCERTDRDGEREVVVFLGPERIADTGAGAEFLKSIVERAGFIAEEARHWSGEAYDWEVVRGYLERLVQQGLLTVE